MGIITILFLELNPSNKIYAQNSTTIEGKLLDSQQNPVVGGNIYLKGKRKKCHVTTNTEGYFKLVIPPNHAKIIVIKAENYTMEEVKIKDIPPYWVKELSEEEVIWVGGYTKVSRYRRFWRKITSPC